MLNEDKHEDDVGHAYKCSGIPFYPSEDSFYEKRIEGVSQDYIKSRQKHVRTFLNKHGFDLPIDED